MNYFDSNRTISKSNFEIKARTDFAIPITSHSKFLFKYYKRNHGD